MPIDTTYQDTIASADTIYGIANEMSVPIRQTDVEAVSIKKPIEKLFNPTPNVVDVANWQILILLISILLIGFVKAFSNNRFSQGLKAFFNYSVAQEITREEEVFFHRANIFFTFVHLLTLSLFVFQLGDFVYSGPFQANNFSFFLLLLTFFAGMYVVKYIFSRLLSFVFNDSSLASEYIFNVSLYNNLLGAILVPILCVIYFTLLSYQSVLMYIAIPLMVIVFLLRLFRLFKMGQIKGVSYFYIFVYICTLEILPLVVLFRIFIL